jgi:hypothetical protein
MTKNYSSSIGNLHIIFDKNNIASQLNYLHEIICDEGGREGFAKPESANDQRPANKLARLPVCQLILARPQVCLLGYSALKLEKFRGGVAEGEGEGGEGVEKNAFLRGWTNGLSLWQRAC